MKKLRRLMSSANQRIKEQLEKMLDSGRMAGSVLFVGGSAASRKEIGMWLCQKVLCFDTLSTNKFLHGNHEDFIYITKPEDKESIVVNQIEELIDRLSFKPYGKSYAVLIEGFELAREAAQNKLLKTLEEPSSDAMIVLLTERADAVLATIRSRCISFVLEEEQDAQDESIKKMAEEFAKKICAKAPYYEKKRVIADILSDKDTQREKALRFLDVLEETLEKELLAGADVSLISRAVKQAETGRMYLKQVHNVSYTLKQMCLRV